MKIPIYALLLLVGICGFAPLANAQSPCWIQMHPTDNSKFVFQIMPEKNFTKVAISVNFYNSAGEPIKLNRKFYITTDKRKYLLASNQYSFILAHNLQNVASVSLAYLFQQATFLGLQTNGQPEEEKKDDDSTQRWGGDVVSNSNSSQPLEDISLAKGVDEYPDVRTLLVVVNERKNMIVKGSWHCDLEKREQSAVGDFWWKVEGRMGTIVPDGARFYILPDCPDCYDKIAYDELLGYDQQQLFTTNDIALGIVRAPSLVAFVTRNNLYGVMRIEGLVRGADRRGLDLKISVKTFGNPPQ